MELLRENREFVNFLHHYILNKNKFENESGYYHLKDNKYLVFGYNKEGFCCKIATPKINVPIDYTNDWIDTDYKVCINNNISWSFCEELEVDIYEYLEGGPTNER